MTRNHLLYQALIFIAALLSLSACQTVSKSQESADLAWDRGDYIAALRDYEKVLDERVSAEAKSHAQRRIIESRRFITEQFLADAQAVTAPSGSRTALLNAQLDKLRAGLEFDDNAQRLANQITYTETLLAEHTQAIADLKSEIEQLLADGHWQRAMEQVAKAKTSEPGMVVFDDFLQSAIAVRDTTYLNELRSLLANADLAAAQKLADAYRKELPRPDYEFIAQVDHDILEHIEDGIPARLQQLIDAKRYYEAHRLLLQTTRNSTRQEFAFLIQEGVDFYRAIALAARRAGKRALGVGYYASQAAYILNPGDALNFELRRDYSDEVIEQLESMVGFLTFDSPSERPDDGLIFTDTVMTNFSRQLPFGLQIVDRSMMDRIVTLKDSDRNYAISEYNIKRMIGGSVLSLDTEQTSTTVKRTDYFTRKVSEPNPFYDPDRREGNEDIPAFIEKEELVPHTYDVTRASLEVSMKVSVQLVDARSNQLVKINGISHLDQFGESKRIESESFEAQPLLNLQAKPAQLPSASTLERELHNQLAEQVVQFLLSGFADQEEHYLASFRHALDRREIPEAYFELAKAHAYWNGTLTMLGKQPDPKLLHILEVGLVELAPYLAKFYEPTQKAAQTQPTAVSAFEPSHAPSADRHYAVIVGISNYEDQNIPSLNYASKDARAFYDFMINESEGGARREDVTLLIDHEATVVNIRSAVNKALQSAQPSDEVTIYFAGHGSPDSFERQDRLFLIGYDTRFDDILSTGYPMEDFNRALKDLARARRITILADACHSGGIGASFEVARRALVPVAPRLSADELADVLLSNFALEPEEDAAPESADLPRRCVALISAASAEETSQEGPQYGGGHGAFTYFLLRGLRGDADLDKDSKVTLGEIANFLPAEVARATKNMQNPTFSGNLDPQKVLSRNLKW